MREILDVEASLWTESAQGTAAGPGLGGVGNPPSSAEVSAAVVANENGECGDGPTLDTTAVADPKDKKRVGGKEAQLQHQERRSASRSISMY